MMVSHESNRSKLIEDAVQKPDELYNFDFHLMLTKAAERNAIIVTDPPYNINFGYRSYKDNCAEHDYIKMLAEFQGFRAVIIQYPEETIKYLGPALGTPKECWAWCYNSNINRRFRLVNFYGIEPDNSKVKQPYKNPNDRRIKALIDAGSEGTAIYDWFSDIQLVKNVSKEKTIHPCPIPESLIERIIRCVAQPGDVIWDPFMGCGTVPSVAKRLGYDFIGTEIDPIYFEVAKQRVATTIRGGSL